jgi:dihydroorotate dehydrogenase (fumarate)
MRLDQALIRHGPQQAAILLAGLLDWMARKGYSSVGELRAANSARSPW